MYTYIASYHLVVVQYFPLMYDFFGIEVSLNTHSYKYIGTGLRDITTCSYLTNLHFEFSPSLAKPL